MTVLFVLFKHSFILFSWLLHQFSLAMEWSILKISLISFFILCQKYSHSFSFIPNVIANIFLWIWPCINTLAMFFIIFKVSNIFLPVNVSLCPNSVSYIELKLPVVSCAIWIYEDSFTGEFVIFSLALVGSRVRPYQGIERRLLSFASLVGYFGFKNLIFIGSLIF